MKKSFLLALVGGPCGGKDALQGHIERVAKSLGIVPVFLPEPAIPFIADIKKAIAAEDWRALLDLEVQVGELFLQELAQAKRGSEARGDEYVLYVANRAIPEIGVFFPEGELGDGFYESMLRSLGFTSHKKALAFYDAIIKVTTTAYGAEPFYKCEGHASRDEGLEAARKQDDRIHETYKSHPRYHLIGNSDDGWKGKVDRAIAAVSQELWEAFPESRKEIPQEIQV